MSCTRKFAKYRSAITEQITENLRQHLPVLNERQIRRHRLPYADALCLELEEDELSFSAEFIRSLLKYQEHKRKISEAKAIPWTFPFLKDENKLLDKLYEGLKAAEIAVKEGKIELRCDHFLQMAIYFTKLSITWCWISDQLYKECVNTVDHYVGDGGEKEAIVRYVYGTFLLDSKNDPEEAKHQFKICRDMSAGKSWSASKVLGTPRISLFLECCSYLYRTLLIIAKITMDTDPLKAARICSMAQNRAIDAEDRQGEANSLMLLGLCEMKAGDAISALSRFNKVLNIHHSESNSTGVCECRIQLALAHSRIGNMAQANYHLKQMLEYADKNNLKFYYGQAHRFLGELNLKEEQPHLATPLLIKALTIFHELDDQDNREQVRALVAISAGQELYPAYINLVQSCKTRTECGENFKKLIKWKEIRDAFWDTDVHSKIDRKIFQQNDYEEIN